MAKDNQTKTVVRRVKAADSKSGAATKDSGKVVRKASIKPSKKTVNKSTEPKNSFFLFRPFFAFGRYFRDSWRELRQVRWPNRRATWALTLAVILFSLIFAAFIMLFDWLFNYLIQEVIL